ncbi:hypothetical protein AcW1_002742 [Taiwanofungus camphoratus]|nr:hypothetical protein AcV5_009584 [Antrodia cinnamomea]KAI0943623.1 hypothetical protein AcW1_002742 [Antrodia cinnamomea]
MSDDCVNNCCEACCGLCCVACTESLSNWTMFANCGTRGNRGGCCGSCCKASFDKDDFAPEAEDKQSNMSSTNELAVTTQPMPRQSMSKANGNRNTGDLLDRSQT